MAPPLARLPKALLVAGVAALVFGGLLGTVQAANGEAPAAEELNQLVLRQPAVGDRWTYQAFLEGGWMFGPSDEQRTGAPFSYGEFEWLDPVLMRDAEGRETGADRLLVHLLDYEADEDQDGDGHQWSPDEERYLYRLGTTEGIAHETPVESQGGQGSSEYADVAVLQQDSSDVVEGWSRSLGPIQAPCLARSWIQDSPIPLDEPLKLPSDCLPAFPDLSGLMDWAEGWADYGSGDYGSYGQAGAGYNAFESLGSLVWDWGWDTGDVTYTYAGRDVVAGHDSARFDSDFGSLWLSEDVPVPVQWSSQGFGFSTVLTLSSFTPGDVPLGSTGPLASDSLAPPVVLAPRQIWGPDDTGSGHPFPASMAFETARKDPTWPNLRDWLKQHPEAATFWLEYSEDLDSSPQQRAWFFGLTDGPSSMAFIVAQATQPPLPLPPVYRFQDRSDTVNWEGFSLAPDPDHMPLLLPTVASMEARWQAYEATEGRSDPFNGWAMALFCLVQCWGAGGWTGGADYGVPDDVLAGRGAIGDVSVGHDPVTAFHFEVGDQFPSLRPGDVTGRSFSGSQLNVGSDGTTKAIVNWTGYSKGLASDPLAGQSPVDPTPEKGSDNKIRLVAAAFIPTPKQGAAIAAFSGLVGLLYWLWPTLKGGSFLGLFSRLRGPELVQHPSRKLLMELIQAEPGIHFQDLVRKSGLANGTAVHHLHKLEQADLLAARPLGRYTCYFPGSSPDRASLATAPVTRSDGARRILAELAANPGLSGQQVAARLGLQHSTVSYHVKRLQDVGLVMAQRDGRVVRFRTVGAAA